MEEKIIDLVDVISEPGPERQKVFNEIPKASPTVESITKIDTGELESLVRKEVERLIQSTVNKNIQEMIREILVQEAEKAIAREMEKLKRV